MKETLENELKKWEEEYDKELEELVKTHPIEENTLSNRHPINELDKKYWEKKEKILKKYGIQ